MTLLCNVKNDEMLNKRNGKFDPQEHYDIKDERYYIPNHTVYLSLAELANLPYLDISCGSLTAAVMSEEFWETHARNYFIVTTNDHCFHSTTFEAVKAQSCYVHHDFGLSAEALVALVDILGMHEGLENHSYVRICPELIFALSFEVRDTIGRLTSEQITELAVIWQTEVLSRYQVEAPECVRGFWFGWIVDYDHAHYSVDYFTELLLNIYELVRSCEADETILIAIDY